MIKERKYASGEYATMDHRQFSLACGYLFYQSIWGGCVRRKWNLHKNKRFLSIIYRRYVKRSIYDDSSDLGRQMYERVREAMYEAMKITVDWQS